MTKRPPIASLAKIRESYHRQTEFIEAMQDDLDHAVKEYTLGHDAGLLSLRSGTGKFGRGGDSGNKSDTTAQASYEFHRLQGASRFAGKLIMEAEIDLRRASLRLERASAVMLNAWLDTDPEVGAERREKRKAAVGGDDRAQTSIQESLTLERPAVILPAVGADDGA